MDWTTRKLDADRQASALSTAPRARSNGVRFRSSSALHDAAEDHVPARGAPLAEWLGARGMILLDDSMVPSHGDGDMVQLDG